MKKPLGVIAYEGASVLTGEPIVLILNFKSANDKTGNMVQSWILNQNENPVEATQSGNDENICGSCPHRHFLGGSCYVNVGQAPNSVYKGYKRGIYPKLSEHPELIKYFSNRRVRAGSYGDPAAIPAAIWANLKAVAKGWTGYTHQVNHKNFDTAILDFAMVSADTPKSALKAHQLGFRTFRVATPNAPLLPNEILCPNETTGIECIDCLQCSGATDAGKNIVIPVHGSRKSKYIAKYERANLIAVA